MASFNKVILMGNLTRDPELKYTQSNMAVCKVGVAVNRRYKDAQTQEWIEKPT
ncbi:MAG TPA: single-stranded DNA-binding protein, partial [Planctomycetota bacterium]|nr:single-stranded DNA-binding protein [Planctomycetota bacterium]